MGLEGATTPYDVRVEASEGSSQLNSSVAQPVTNHRCARGQALSANQFPKPKRRPGLWLPNRLQPNPTMKGGWCSPQQPPCSDGAGEDTCTESVAAL